MIDILKIKGFTVVSGSVEKMLYYANRYHTPPLSLGMGVGVPTCNLMGELTFLAIPWWGLKDFSHNKGDASFSIQDFLKKKEGLVLE